jgi:23S rRNA (uracil1939-C5)-methyltransferase
VHVPGVLPGEHCTAEIAHRSQHRSEAWASLSTLERTSPSRVQPACAAYGQCGGCTLQHWSSEAQLDWKHRHLAELLATTQLPSCVLTPPVASPRSLGYRNKGKWVVGRRKDEVVLGAYQPRSHAIVDLRGCAVLEPAVAEAGDLLRELMASASSPLQPYDEATGTGDLRHVVVRGNERGETLVVLVARTRESAAAAELAAALPKRLPHLVGVVLNINASRGNAIFGREDHLLVGQPWLDDRLGDVRLRLSARAFFQANREVATAAYNAIADAAAIAPGDKVIDAYCGIGGIGLTLGLRGARVFGIEEHAAAVEDALLAARLNGVADATFVAGDVAAHLRAAGDASVVVLNPPRKGCDPSVLQAAAWARPRLIAYLSCRPATLLRDLARLGELGYETESLTALDMMPQTPQIEALALLRPRPQTRVDAA